MIKQSSMQRLSSSSSEDLPDCDYEEMQPISLIKPKTPTPNHTLFLSNLDDQKFLRFSIKYLYLFKKSVSIHTLKSSLSRVLVDYYPLAGRLRKTTTNNNHNNHDHNNNDNDNEEEKLEVECNGEGAVFAEAFMDITADDFLQLIHKPNKSWRKLLYRVDARTFLDIPPLVVQVTNLRCGGMIMCTSINHCLCDGIGTSQFLHDWAYLTTNLRHTTLPIPPFHSRHVFKPRSPSSHLPLLHPAFTKNTPPITTKDNPSLNHHLQSQSLVPASLIFNASHILHLKRGCVPSLKCTTFEVLAYHTWRSWVKSLDLAPSLHVKLLFSMNIRKHLNPKIPQGYYGNGFVLACVEATAEELVNANLHYGVKLVQQAKSSLTHDRINGIVQVLQDKTIKPDLTASLVISQWSKLGLEELDFGQGKPIHMGSLTSDIYCLFLPVVSDSNAVRVLVSLPESVVAKFEYYMNDFVYENNVKPC